MIKTKIVKPAEPVSRAISVNMMPEAWDSELGSLGGHPLQSTLWGDLRRVPDQRLAIIVDGRPVWMARVEERKFPGIGKVAWIPKGPTAADPKDAAGPLPREFVSHLKAAGFQLIITDPYVELDEIEAAPGDCIGQNVHTIWIDLTYGEQAAFTNLDKKWRNGVRRAEKEGVIVKETDMPSDIDQFVSICRDIAKLKSFSFDVEDGLVEQLIKGTGTAAKARLYVAKKDETVLAGALILIIGTHWHYLWGGTDRNYSQFRAGEAVQWSIILDGIKKGATLYDLEGIDEQSNSGTAAFKKKMGGRNLQLIGRRAHPLGLSGKAMSFAIRFREKHKA